MALRREQLGVLAGMAGGLIATAAALLWPTLPAVDPSLEGRARLWAVCAVAAVLPLLVAVALLARDRFFSAADIDAATTQASTRARTLQALVQNTLEQAVLAIVAYGGWLMLGPPDRHGLVIVCVVLFAVGRLLFFLGYKRGAPARALGFALTFYSNAALLLMLVPRLF